MFRLCPSFSFPYCWSWTWTRKKFLRVGLLKFDELSWNSSEHKNGLTTIPEHGTICVVSETTTPVRKVRDKEHRIRVRVQPSNSNRILRPHTHLRPQAAPISLRPRARAWSLVCRKCTRTRNNLENFCPSPGFFKTTPMASIPIFLFFHESAPASSLE